MLRTSNSPNSRPNSAHLHHRRESEVAEKAENIAEDYSASTQNASENSVVYTYYKGSPENAVEEHFERTRKAIKENSEGYGEQNCKFIDFFDDFYLRLCEAF